MPIRVLLVDDSAVMRTLLRRVLAGDPSITLVGVAADGVEAVAQAAALKPDIILLDIEMPRMNGLEALEALRAQGSQARIIMCSTLTRRGAGITLEALARGATDYVAKPTAANGPESALRTLREDLLPKIHALSGRTAWPTTIRQVSIPPAAVRINRLRAVVIGVSTGGPAALEKLLPGLPSLFPLPVLIAQHMPQVFTSLLAERLNGLCALRVCEASAGIIPEPGHVYIARGDWHLEVLEGVASRAPRLQLSQVAGNDFCRPSVDVLFRSAAAAYGAGVIAVMLTGMGSDGLEGVQVVRSRGGCVIAQDRATSAVWGMPGVIVEAGLADRVLALDAIAAELVRLALPASRFSHPAFNGAAV
ncbi:protein-glutamate methylesterase/protein-glutamine glutaminase [Acidipila rosea]|uniref:Protein-glutamate methylesterase/protein-glutamine glutaminase n=1 Tax=Acidipila rosea TaxID=768535 RepID=A0A4R1L1P8_9BACT|nr:chemotaxis response regulator protein-glutamate methylesterase [Acidipila rosea]TCK70793.1 response regulator receiver-modulated CheB methylesterase [Acidipila rosea]